MTAPCVICGLPAEFDSASVARTSAGTHSLGVSVPRVLRNQIHGICAECVREITGRGPE